MVLNNLKALLNGVLGFKSYPVRTQITGWDSSFNAITGLNGSGKSNILDAICFVLGITNMSQVSEMDSIVVYTLTKRVAIADESAESTGFDLQARSGWDYKS